MGKAVGRPGRERSSAASSVAQQHVGSGRAELQHDIQRRRVLPEGPSGARGERVLPAGAYLEMARAAAEKAARHSEAGGWELRKVVWGVRWW